MWNSSKVTGFGWALATAGLLLLAACQKEPSAPAAAAPAPAEPATQVAVAAVDAERIIHADREPGNWMSHGRTYDEQRYSPLSAINEQNVSSLGLAWYFDLDSERGQEATPIVVDGRMYVSTAWSMVKALDAATGELLWSYDPGVPRAKSLDACCDAVNRGVAVWGGRVYVGTLDGRLVALDAASGQVVWSVQTTDPEQRYTITGAPRVVKGRVIIGNGGAEMGVRGYVTAYDAETGAQAWRFYTVPGNPELGFESPALERAAETWTGEWWEFGGGGTVWDSMAYDPDLDLLYIGVGNGSPWNRHIRSPGGGDNLYLSSIVALDPDDGAYVWHYQTTPGDTWDFTATQHLILADLEVEGQVRKVIMQAPKNGFFYVLDRSDGELISARNFVPVTWATGIDPDTGRPEETPEARWSKESMALVQPGPGGAHNWQPMSYSPQTGLVYLPAMEAAFPYFADQDFHRRELAWNTGADFGAGAMPVDPAVQQQVLSGVNGHLAAWDPVAQREVWRVQHGGAWNSGVLSTAGNLLVQGLGNGDFTIYRADSGEKLWAMNAQTGIMAAPVTYLAGGEQYIAVEVGWGGIMGLVPGLVGRKGNLPRNISRVLAFKLGGAEALPPAPPEPERTLVQSDREVSEEEAAQGKALYHHYCVNCHGDIVVSAGLVSDLRYSDVVDTEAWQSVVADGAMHDIGMVGFGSVLSEADLTAIESYVITRARQTAEAAAHDGE